MTTKDPHAADYKVVAATVKAATDENLQIFRTITIKAIGMCRTRGEYKNAVKCLKIVEDEILARSKSVL